MIGNVMEMWIGTHITYGLYTHKLSSIGECNVYLDISLKKVLN
jgi:hypothetical protein